eukprot:TRINITY_DN79456_c0_g1_i1.p1 TRINITY_DN79456_c0_g1~~TRINITY_DN79456_c0_g1_i1.p1  ORF type:complete len:605 (-),score=153.08 TRINITY_DN79456_c0_g1_i1:193-2007(-)
MVVSGKSQLPEDLQKLQEEVLAGLESDGGESEDDADDPSRVVRPLTGSAGRPATGGPSQFSERAVLVAAGEERVEDVRQLLFRHQRLQSLTLPGTIDFLRLTSLEVLSLSHNELTDIQPLSLLVGLTEVNLNFNHIKDLSPLYECELLLKLFAAHNHVVSIEGLAARCSRLQELSLFANRFTAASGKELLRTLEGLSGLRSLDIGENCGCCSAPSQRQELLRLLPRLELLDGHRVTSTLRSGLGGLGSEEVENLKDVPAGSSSRPSSGSRAEGAEPSDPGDDESLCSMARPGTAPATSMSRPKGARPPPLPSVGGGGYPSLVALPLAGQKLKSARANRMDDVLTRSREASPQVHELSQDGPEQAIQVLAVHAEALRRRLDTQQAERENLRFQVRLLQKDAHERQPDHFQKQVADLKVENRSMDAINDEHGQLQLALAEVDDLLARLDDQAHVDGSAKLQAEEDEAGAEEGLTELRLEMRRLEKRLEQVKRYNTQLLEDVERAKLRSAQRALGYSQKDIEAAQIDDPEIDRLIASNEDKLRRLQLDVRDTATAMAKNRAHGSNRPPPGHNSSAVDVLTIGAGCKGEDVEWHGESKSKVKGRSLLT